MRKGLFSNEFYSEGYVVFEAETNLWWLKFLKKGFRHCYILIKNTKDASSWLEINPMSNQICLFEHQNLLGMDYISYLRNVEKLTVIYVKFHQAPQKCAPLFFFTCVEFVKRMIGIHNFFLFTPHQLYKKIQNISRL